MTRKNGLPVRVYLRHSRYYLVDLAGKWLPLTRERDGLPAMYRALAKITETEIMSDRMPAVIARWLESKAGDWSPKAAEDQARIGRQIGERFADFKPGEVTTPICAQYLKPLRTMPRTHNLHRTALRQILAMAAVEGLREGHNPIDNIPAMTMVQRVRIVTDAEIAAIKSVAAGWPRGGRALVQMIDLALLTGQRIGDVLRMRWQDVTDAGVLVRQAKTSAYLLIGWSPALHAAVGACAQGRDRIGHLLKQQTGQPHKYGAIRAAWMRACAQAGIKNLHIHDMRGRAGVDSMLGGDIRDAQGLLGHTTEAMTRKYVEGKYAKLAKPSK